MSLRTQKRRPAVACGPPIFQFPGRRTDPGPLSYQVLETPMPKVRGSV